MERTIIASYEGALNPHTPIRGEGDEGGEPRTTPERLDHSVLGRQNPSHPMAMVVFIEIPDPSGKRWRLALDLLLEAGRAAPENASDR